MEDSDQKALDNIEEYGCHILNIMECEEYPNFSYSIGIEKTRTQPELIVVGLKHTLAQSIINDYCERLKSGETFEPGKLYSGFIEGFDVCFIEVDPKHYDETFCYAQWLYEGNGFRGLQMIYPTVNGVWPWDSEASESYLWWQRILNKSGKLLNAL